MNSIYYRATPNPVSQWVLISVFKSSSEEVRQNETFCRKKIEVNIEGDKLSNTR